MAVDSPVAGPLSGRRWRVLPVDVTHEASGFELLFDVITAFGIEQITREVLTTPTGTGVLRAAVILAMLWGCWMNYCWVANSVRADVGIIRTLHAAALGGMVVAGMTVGYAFSAPGLTGRAIALLTAYLVIRCTSAISLWLAQGPAARGRAVVVLGAAFWTVGTIVVATRLTGGAEILAWLLAVCGEIVAAGAFTRNWRISSAEHLAGRYGFIISVGLEMSLGGIALTAFGHPVTVQMIILIGTALAIAVLLWWLYFDTLSLYARHQVSRVTSAESDDHHRLHARLAYLHYSLLHMLLLAGMIGFGLTVRKIALTIIAPDVPRLGAPLPSLWASCLIGGFALYLATIALMWRMLDDRLHLSNIVVAVVAVGALPFIRHVPELSILAGITALCLGLLITHLALPWNRTRRHHVRGMVLHAGHHDTHHAAGVGTSH